MNKQERIERLVTIMRNAEVDDPLERAIHSGAYNSGVATLNYTSKWNITIDVINDLYSALRAVKRSPSFDLGDVEPRQFLDGILYDKSSGKRLYLYKLLDDSNNKITLKAIRRRLGNVSTYEILAAYVIRFSPLEKLARVIGDPLSESVEHYETSSLKGSGTNAVATFKFGANVSPYDIAFELCQAITTLIHPGYVPRDFNIGFADENGPFLTIKQEPVEGERTGRSLYRITKIGDQIIVHSLVEKVGDIVGADALLAAFRITYEKRKMMK